jgi:hypothetical protein
VITELYMAGVEAKNRLEELVENNAKPFESIALKVEEMRDKLTVMQKPFVSKFNLRRTQSQNVKSKTKSPMKERIPSWAIK